MRPFSSGQTFLPSPAGPTATRSHNLIAVLSSHRRSFQQNHHTTAGIRVPEKRRGSEKKKKKRPESSVIQNRRTDDDAEVSRTPRNGGPGPRSQGHQRVFCLLRRAAADGLLTTSCTTLNGKLTSVLTVCLSESRTIKGFLSDTLYKVSSAKHNFERSKGQNL